MGVFFGRSGNLRLVNSRDALGFGLAFDSMQESIAQPLGNLRNFIGSCCMGQAPEGPMNVHLSNITIGVGSFHKIVSSLLRHLVSQVSSPRNLFKSTGSEQGPALSELVCISSSRYGFSWRTLKREAPKLALSSFSSKPPKRVRAQITHMGARAALPVVQCLA